MRQHIRNVYIAPCAHRAYFWVEDAIDLGRHVIMLYGLRFIFHHVAFTSNISHLSVRLPFLFLFFFVMGALFSLRDKFRPADLCAIP